MKREIKNLNYGFSEAGITISCRDCSKRDLPRIKHILKELGLNIVSINIKPTGKRNVY